MATRTAEKTRSALSSSEVLSLAADLIEPAGKWVRDWTARRVFNAEGHMEATLAHDPRAEMWGGTGAIYKIGRDAGMSPQQCFEIQEIAARAVGCPRRWFTDWAWAPERTQAEVVGGLRQAAELAMAEGR